MKNKYVLSLSFILFFSYKSLSQTCCTNPGCVFALFTAPGTILVNTTVSATNLSSCAGSYFWNLCSGNLTQTPTGVNLGNLGVSGSWDYYPRVEFAFDGTNYYAFTSMFIQGNLTRSNFGNSLLNTPTSSNLGNFGGNIKPYMEGIQIEKEGSNWYLFGVSGNPNNFYRLDFGSSLGGTATATSFGTIGGLNFPHGLDVVQDLVSQDWYGFTVNRNNGTLTRFYFGNSLTNTPTGVNLGNIGGMSGSTTIRTIYVGGNWYGFITNGYTNSVTRLSFGSTLASTPTGVNLGNIGGLDSPYDFTIISDCNSTIGLITNNWNGVSTAPSDIIRVTFPSGITGPMVGTSLGNFGGFVNPEGISDIYRDNKTGNLYALVANGGGGTGGSISRIKFAACTSSSIATSTSSSPPIWSYPSTGVYNVSLTINQGTLFEKSYCQPITVVGVLGIADFNFIGFLDKNNHPYINWSLNGNDQVREFEVKRMVNGEISTIETISVEVNNNGSYSFTDVQIYDPKGIYYKIDAINWNGEKISSDWIPISSSNEDVFVKIFPNPMKDNSVLAIESNTNWDNFALYDTKGLVINRGQFDNSTMNSRYYLSISGLSSGIYNLSISNSNISKNIKLVVN